MLTCERCGKNYKGDIECICNFWQVNAVVDKLTTLRDTLQGLPDSYMFVTRHGKAGDRKYLTLERNELINTLTHEIANMWERKKLEYSLYYWNQVWLDITLRGT